MRPNNRDRGGWTLIELLIVVTLLGGILTKTVMVTQTALGLASDESASMHYEDQARRTMDRIALAVMGSDRDMLVPTAENVPFSSLRYSFNLGLEDGVIVWSDPEQIRLSDGQDAVEWYENPGAVEERRAVWTNLVSPLLEGEIVNGIDDNGNGLVDETGLSFVLEGNTVRIRLTLRRPEVDGRTVMQTVEQVVSCRN